MNTPAHLIFGAAAFARPGSPGTTAASLIGALTPDVSLYLLTGWALYVQKIPARVVFGELYFSSAWQGIFAVDNAIPLWGALLLAGLLLRTPVVVAFAGAGLLHLGFDFALHHDDARRQFWPISDWVFQSPLSYWDRDYYGVFVGALEIAACVALTALLWRRFQSWRMRAMFAALLVAEFVPGIMFALMMH